MAYARSGPTNEVQQLQQEITHEVNTDAEHLASAVFGKPGNMPDLQRMDNATLDARYRTAYQTQDRKFLIAEAQRDPNQFVTVARRIGVQLPAEQPAPAPTPAPVPLAPIMPAPPAPLPPPVGSPTLPLPGPVATPLLPPTVPAPGIL